MRSKSSFYLLVIIFLNCGVFSSAQTKNEREHRIKKSQFPEKALLFIHQKMVNAKRVRFYKEIDNGKRSYEAKFKKDRLKYSVEFTEEGDLEDIEVTIKQVDIPNEVYDKITAYLENNFKNYRILKIQQQYPMVGERDIEKTLKDAFQNLILPYIKYELVVNGKGDAGFEQYEFLFSSEGKFEVVRKALPPNYDHVLY